MTHTAFISEHTYFDCLKISLTFVNNEKYINSYIYIYQFKNRYVNILILYREVISFVQCVEVKINSLNHSLHKKSYRKIYNLLKFEQLYTNIL